MNRRAVVALGAMVAMAMVDATMLTGCPPCGDPARTVARFDFEGDCADELCGFTATSGHAARDVAFQPGEHAMRLDADTTVHRSLDVLLTGGNEQIAMLARCDPGVVLTVTETVVQPFSASADGGIDAGRDAGAGALQTVHHTVSLQATTEWSRLTQRFPVRFSSQTSTGSMSRSTATDLEITVAGGQCWLDDVNYQDVIQQYFCA